MSDIRTLEEVRDLAKRRFRVTRQPTFVVSLDSGEGYDYQVVSEKFVNDVEFEAFDGVIIEAFE
jgi:hypothetical protein